MNVQTNTQPDLRPLARSHYGELARIGKALASPVRLQFLDLLRQGSRRVVELAVASGETVANSSRHLGQMRSARLVSAEREGKHVRYRLAADGVSAVYGALRGLAESLLPEMDRLRTALGVLGHAEREALLALIARRAVTLLDVRPAEEFLQGHLPGARSIPLPYLPARLGELPRDREVVAYCRGPYCPMATEAVEILVAAGFSARHLDLDVPTLRESGLPVESGPPTGSGPAGGSPARRRAWRSPGNSQPKRKAR